MIKLRGLITRFGIAWRDMVAWLLRPIEFRKPESSVRIKRVYTMMPTQEEVVAQVTKLAKQLDVPVPPIVFVDTNINVCEDDHLELMEPSWAIEHDGPPAEGWYPLHLRYWESILHELSHWITFKKGLTSEVSHSREMYMVLISLVLAEGFPLDVLWEGERRYMPGSLRRGTKAVGEYMLEMLLGQSPAREVTPRLVEASSDIPLVAVA